MYNKFKYWLWNWVFSYLTKPVKLDHIITYNSTSGQIYMDGRLVSAAEVKSLQEQVKAFNMMSLKTVLLNTPKTVAESQIYNSKSMDEMIGGKLVLYTLDLQETILQRILNAPEMNQVQFQQNPYRK
jgi:hypothetical protein